MKSKNITKTFYNVVRNIFGVYFLKNIKERFINTISVSSHSKTHDISTNKSLEKLVESKISKINRYNIKFDYSLVSEKNLGNIDNRDFILVMDDLLENAINLCKNVEIKSSRWIKLNIYRENMHLFIDIFNSANSEGIVTNSNLNIKYLRKFLKKYDGILHSFNKSSNIFFTEIQILLKNDMINMDINESKRYLFKGVPLHNYISQS